MFITDIDEQIYKLIEIIYPKLLEDVNSNIGTPDESGEDGTDKKGDTGVIPTKSVAETGKPPQDLNRSRGRHRLNRSKP